MAWLHDVLEDTKTAKDDLIKEFGQGIADAVSFLTDQPGANRKERKSATYKRLGSEGKAYVTVKLADRIANIRNCIETKNKGLFQMYLKERDELAYYLKIKDPYGAYRNNNMWAVLEQLYLADLDTPKKKKEKPAAPAKKKSATNILAQPWNMPEGISASTLNGFLDDVMATIGPPPMAIPRPAPYGRDVPDCPF